MWSLPKGVPGKVKLVSIVFLTRLSQFIRKTYQVDPDENEKFYPIVDLVEGEDPSEGDP